jgi:two-component system, chemotaxis family, CheB/CheR fusion protein
LLDDLLISVTTFFRDSEAFDALKAHVIPHLFEGKDLTASIRVWVPGCVNGEEAYSIGILLLEEAAQHDVCAPIQLFGSDLDSRSLTMPLPGHDRSRRERGTTSQVLLPRARSISSPA